jgi:glycosyltransferase involved in cell wall biosynthesis
MPRVSVIIPTHNRAHLVERAVRSAREAGRDIEVIVVDDASTDETRQLCRSLAGVRYVRAERNQKIGGARNLGILASTSDYISFLDDDDLKLPGSLDVQLEALARQPEAGLVYGQALLGDQDCAPTGNLYPEPCPQGDIFWELLEKNFIPCPSVLFRKSCLYRIGLPCEWIPGIEDWDLWIRIAELYPVAAVEEPLAIYRRATPSSGQYTSRAAEMVRLITYTWRRRWIKLPRAARADERKRKEAWRRLSRNMANHLIWEAGREIFSRHPLRAQKNVLVGLRLHPLGMLHRATRPSNFRFSARLLGEWLEARKQSRLKAVETE